MYILFILSYIYIHHIEYKKNATKIIGFQTDSRGLWTVGTIARLGK